MGAALYCSSGPSLRDIWTNPVQMADGFNDDVMEHSLLEVLRGEIRRADLSAN